MLLLCAVVLQVLEKDNYVDWSVRVKTYLMDHDLWDVIEATIEPPSLEDDEVAFKAWSMKNSTALHVIQISCGPNTISKIIQISSAKIAWDTLAKKFFPVLKEDNYAYWSVQIKNYLMAHDLWEIIEATTKPPKQEDDETAFKAWSTRNFTALHLIQISCGPDTGFEIIQITSAKTAWDTLAEKYGMPIGADIGVDSSPPLSLSTVQILKIVCILSCIDFNFVINFSIFIIRFLSFILILNMFIRQLIFELIDTVLSISTIKFLSFTLILNMSIRQLIFELIDIVPYISYH
jgi:hypothetical protein